MALGEKPKHMRSDFLPDTKGCGAPNVETLTVVAAARDRQYTSRLVGGHGFHDSQGNRPIVEGSNDLQGFVIDR